MSARAVTTAVAQAANATTISATLPADVSVGRATMNAAVEAAATAIAAAATAPRLIHTMVPAPLRRPPGRRNTLGLGGDPRSPGTEGPVEFDPLSSDFFDDPYDTYRWLRDEAPVYHNERYGFWALSRFADVVAAHRDWKTFSSEHGLTIDQLTDPNSGMKGTSIIMMDPPEHDRMRKLVSRVFTPRAMAALEPMIRDVITSYLAPLDGAD